MIVGTFNGWNIIGLPASPGVKQYEWELLDAIGEVTSPYTGQAQQQDWSTDAWSGKLSLPGMPQGQFAPWAAWLAEMRGKLNCFQLGEPFSLAPQGQANLQPGGPVCAAGNLARSRFLATSRWTANVQGQLLLFDFVQIGYRLHTVIGANVNSDANGNATLQIWPALREAPAAGQPVILSNPTGLFRLANNKRGWSVANNRLYALAIDVVEAL